MPFKSEEQRRFMWAKHPKIAARWTKKYGSKPVDGLKRATPSTQIQINGEVDTARK